MQQNIKSPGVFTAGIRRVVNVLCEPILAGVQGPP